MTIKASQVPGLRLPHSVASQSLHTALNYEQLQRLLLGDTYRGQPLHCDKVSRPNSICK